MLLELLAKFFLSITIPGALPLLFVFFLLPPSLAIESVDFTESRCAHLEDDFFYDLDLVDARCSHSAKRLDSGSIHMLQPLQLFAIASACYLRNSCICCSSLSLVFRPLRLLLLQL